MSANKETPLGVAEARFLQVIAALPSSFRDQLSQSEQLELYGLYQQATKERPQQRSSLFDPVRRAKDAAWTAVQHLTKAEAMAAYVRVVDRCARQQQQTNDSSTNTVALLELCRDIVTVDTELEHPNRPTMIESSHGAGEKEEYTSSRAASSQQAEDTPSPKLMMGDLAEEESSSAEAMTYSFTHPQSRPESFLGVAPLVPRGRLDIGWLDFVRTSTTAVGPAPPPWPRHLVVGLSVRTLLDAWLQGISTATASTAMEDDDPQPAAAPCIVMTPPINVPGLTDVVRHHGIQIVGVDLPAPDTVAVNVPGVREALDNNTNIIAILVVHVFGQCVATDEELDTLATLAHDRSAALLVDAAESYTGESQRLLFDEPTTAPDITFYSFGLIKTSTALRGGLAVVKDPVVARALRRRMAVYPEAKDTVRLVRKAMLTQFLVTVVPHWCYGFMYSILIGPDQWDRVSRRVLRGFPATAGIAVLRRRLPDALAALLWRRLHAPQLSSVPARIAWAREANSTVPLPHWTLPQWSTAPTSRQQPVHTYWLYPVLAASHNNANDLCRAIRTAGWDATRGGNLECCSETLLPHAQHLMERLVCLPLHTPVRDLVERLDLAAAADKNPTNSYTTPKRAAWSPRQRAMIMVLSVVMLLVLETIGVPLIVTVWQLWWKGTVFGSIGVVGLLLFQHYMGDFYLRTSPAFAQYADVCMDTTPVSRDSSSRCLLDSKHRKEGREAPLPAVVLLTGCTGFVGSMLLRDLLWHRATLGVTKVIVLCRSKRGKNPVERIHDGLLQDPIFQFLSLEEKMALVEVIEGDVSERFGGCSASHRERADVTHFIHCASAVSFKQTLADAATCIITGSLHMQELASSMSSRRPPGDKVQFVQVSTAFVHGQHAASGPLPEKLYSLEPFHPIKIYDSMCSTQYYASQAMAEHGFSNTYTFSKSVAEHLLLRNDPDTIIIRPSIVGPALEEPYAGWAGSMPSTLTAGGCLYLRAPFSLWLWGPHDVPCIPVDQLSHFMLRTVLLRRNVTKETIGEDKEDSLSDDYEKISISSSGTDKSLSQRPSKDDSGDGDSKCVFNATYDVCKSTECASFMWREFACAVLQVGAITGQSNRFFGNLAFVLMDYVSKLQPSHKTYDYIQRCVVRMPMELAISCCRRLGLETKGYERALDIVDLPTLFYPFTMNDFSFQSDLGAPPSMHGGKYSIICATAVCRFSQSLAARSTKLSKGTSEEADCSSKQHYPVSCEKSRAKRGIVWALSQPKGNIITRLAGLLLSHILQMCFQEVTVDLASFCAAARCPETDWMILAPTHRSFFDFILISYISFAIPEMQIEAPVIAAATDFEQMPLIGWLARLLGAFYVSRGRQTRDPHLSQTIRSIKRTRKGKRTTVEIFLEGTRSRDRRFGAPKTGVLRCLHEDGATSVIVPISISYEGIAEEDQLVSEMNVGQRTTLGWTGLIKWLKDAFERRVNLGRVHVAAGEPLHLGDASSLDWNEIADNVQQRQAETVVLTQYHITATSSLLGLAPEEIRSVYNSLGISPSEGSKLPDQNCLGVDSQLTATLQFSHKFAKLFQQHKPDWALWFWMHVSSSEDYETNCEGKSFVTALARLLDQADEYARRGRSSLVARGFTAPSNRHVAQLAVELGYDGPRALLNSSIRRSVHNDSKSVDEDSWELAPSIQTKRIVGNGEELGFWGHHDTKFVVKMDSGRSPYVVLESKQKGHKPKRITGLLAFMTNELGVEIDVSQEAFVDRTLAPVYAQSRFSQADLDELKLVSVKVSTEESERLRRGTGHCHQDIFSIRNQEEFRIPDGVIWPSSESEVQAAIKLASEKSWCLIPFGGGTNVSGATRCPPLLVEPRPILAMDMRLMDKILWVNEEDMVARVQSGITGSALAEKLKRLGFTIGHEPDSLEFSTLGGWIATKASGMKRSKYGNIEDIILGVTAVGSSGVLNHGRDERSAWERESCSFDIRSIFLGSEGCLGVVTSAIVRLWPIPECIEFDSAVLHDFETAVLVARELSKLGELVPASVRILDNHHFRLAQALKPESGTSLQNLRSLFGKIVLSRRGFVADRIVCVTIGYEGSRQAVESQKRSTNKLLSKYSAVQLGSDLGRSAYNATFTIGYLRDFALTYHLVGESFESFVPWSKVESVIDRVRERIMAEHRSRMLPGRPFVGARITQLYTTGACIYFYFCLSFKGINGANEVYSDIEHAARSEILAAGGSLSHHHGIGKIRSPFLADVGTPAVLKTVKQIKCGLDPDNIFAARNGYFAIE